MAHPITTAVEEEVETTILSTTGTTTSNSSSTSLMVMALEEVGDHHIIITKITTGDSIMKRAVRAMATISITPSHHHISSSSIINSITISKTQVIKGKTVREDITSHSNYIISKKTVIIISNYSRKPQVHNKVRNSSSNHRKGQAIKTKIVNQIRNKLLPRLNSKRLSNRHRSSKSRFRNRTY